VILYKNFPRHPSNGTAIFQPDRCARYFISQIDACLRAKAPSKLRIRFHSLRIRCASPAENTPSRRSITQQAKVSLVIRMICIFHDSPPSNPTPLLATITPCCTWGACDNASLYSKARRLNVYHLGVRSAISDLWQSSCAADHSNDRKPRISLGIFPARESQSTNKMGRREKQKRGSNTSSLVSAFHVAILNCNRTSRITDRAEIYYPIVFSVR
jgi:hypothetical protein